MQTPVTLTHPGCETAPYWNEDLPGIKQIWLLIQLIRWKTSSQQWCHHKNHVISCEVILLDSKTTESKTANSFLRGGEEEIQKKELTEVWYDNKQSFVALFKDVGWPQIYFSLLCCSMCDTTWCFHHCNEHVVSWWKDTTEQTWLGFWAGDISKSTFGDPLHEILRTVLEHSLHVFRSHWDFLRLDQHETFSGRLWRIRKVQSNYVCSEPSSRILCDSDIVRMTLRTGSLYCPTWGSSLVLVW